MQLSACNLRTSRIQSAVPRRRSTCVAVVAQEHHGVSVAAAGLLEASAPAENKRRSVLKLGLALGAAAIATPVIGDKAAIAGEAPAVAAVQKAYGAFGQLGATGDIGPLLATMSKDIKWQSNVNGGYSVTGIEGVKQFFAWLDVVNDITTFKPYKFLVDEDGDEVVTLVKLAGKGKVTGVPYKTEIVHVFSVNKEGLLTSFKEIVDQAVLNPAMGTTGFDLKPKKK